MQLTYTNFTELILIKALNIDIKDPVYLRTTPLKQNFIMAAYLMDTDSLDTPEDIPHCDICNEFFRSNRELREHFKRYHPTEKPYTCTECGSQYERKQALTRHIRSSHTQDPGQIFKCPLCPSTFETKEQLNYHLASHTNDYESTNYADDEWDMSGFLETSLRDESSSSDSDNDVLNHQAQVRQNNFKETRSISRLNSTEFAADGQEQAYRCAHCHKLFNSQLYLTEHLRTHGITTAPPPPANPKPFQCGYCPKSFEIVQERTHHERSHLINNVEKKPYACIFCDMSFDQIKEINHHVRRVHNSGKVNETPAAAPITKSSPITTAPHAIMPKPPVQVPTPRPPPAPPTRKLNFLGNKDLEPSKILKNSSVALKSLPKVPKDIVITRQDIALSPPPNLRSSQRQQQQKLNSFDRSSATSSTNAVKSQQVEQVTIIPDLSALGPAPGLFPRHPCTLCDKVFTRSDNLKRHYEASHPQQQFGKFANVNQIGASTSSNLTRPTVTISKIVDSDVSEDSKNSNDSDSNQQLIQSISRTSGQKIRIVRPHTSAAASTTVSPSTNRLVTPSVTIKRFSCQVCSKVFTRSDNLKRHYDENHGIQVSRPNTNNKTNNFETSTNGTTSALPTTSEKSLLIYENNSDKCQLLVSSISLKATSKKPSTNMSTGLKYSSLKSELPIRSKFIAKRREIESADSVSPSCSDKASSSNSSSPNLPIILSNGTNGNVEQSQSKQLFASSAPKKSALALTPAISKDLEPISKTNILNASDSSNDSNFDTLKESDSTEVYHDSSELVEETSTSHNQLIQTNAGNEIPTPTAASPPRPPYVTIILPRNEVDIAIEKSTKQRLTEDKLNSKPISTPLLSSSSKSDQDDLEISEDDLNSEEKSGDKRQQEVDPKSTKQQPVLASSSKSQTSDSNVSDVFVSCSSSLDSDEGDYANNIHDEGPGIEKPTPNCPNTSKGTTDPSLPSNLLESDLSDEEEKTTLPFEQSPPNIIIDSNKHQTYPFSKPIIQVSLLSDNSDSENSILSVTSDDSVTTAKMEDTAGINTQPPTQHTESPLTVSTKDSMNPDHYKSENAVVFETSDFSSSSDSFESAELLVSTNNQFTQSTQPIINKSLPLIVSLTEFSSSKLPPPEPKLLSPATSDDSEQYGEFFVRDNSESRDNFANNIGIAPPTILGAISDLPKSPPTPSYFSTNCMETFKQELKKQQEYKKKRPRRDEKLKQLLALDLRVVVKRIRLVQVPN